MIQSVEKFWKKEKKVEYFSDYVLINLSHFIIIIFMNISDRVISAVNRSKNNNSTKSATNHSKKGSIIDQKLSEIIKVPQKESKRRISEIQIIHNQAFYSQQFYSRELIDNNKPQYLRKLIYQNKILLDQIEKFKNYQVMYYKEKDDCEKWKRLAENCKQKYEKLKQRIGKKQKKVQQLTLDEKSKSSNHNIISPRQESFKWDKIQNKYLTTDTQVGEKYLDFPHKLQKSFGNDSFTYSQGSECETRKLKTELENQKKIRISLELEIIKYKQNIKTVMDKCICAFSQKSLTILNQQSLDLKKQNQQLKNTIEQLNSQLQKEKQTVQKIRGLLSPIITEKQITLNRPTRIK